MARAWYIINTYTGYEVKVERAIHSLLERGELDEAVVCDIKVPVVEKVEVQKDGKKKVKNEIFLPGYVLLELDLPDIGWKKTCAPIRAVRGVTGFVGTQPNVKPRPISAEEAKSILFRGSMLKTEKQQMLDNFNSGDGVKIIGGPFSGFDGNVEEVLEDKVRLRVSVKIFGRVTPVEVSIEQVERV